MKTIGVIPARWGSTRFPGKPLALIAGKPLIQRVWEQCKHAGVFDRIIVATEDRRIVKAVEAFGGEAMLTSKRCASGTDRMGEVAHRVEGTVFVNVQGDGPFVEKKELQGCAYQACGSKAREVVTSAARIRTRKQWEDPSVVKVVCDRKGYALYFSRAPIPAVRGRGWPNDTALAHLSVYAFKRRNLLEYCKLKPTKLEHLEKLEQLRGMAMGWRFRIVMASSNHLEIDTPADVAKAEFLLKRKKS